MPSASWKQRLYAQDHYRRNSARLKAEALEANRRQRAFLAGYVRREKDGKACADCGTEYPHYQLEFDHVRGRKVANVADLVRAPVSLRTLRMEIAKCELVCCNCHAARTWRRRKEEARQEAPEPSDAAEALRLFE